MDKDINCLFCKIASGEIPTAKLFENERVVSFKDISPAAPFHVLVIPKRHIATLNDLGDSEGELVGEMVLAGRRLAVDGGFADSGYRMIMNCNSDGGQEVFHIHLHVIGGRPLGRLVEKKI